ncbi:PREDICTED: cell wall protein DAN4-like [Camelina sativa]|uniref:Cell wall protein DAN4-like n=1 Tax=Camelina sativa TaxID=90675 RepID=A0ABM0XF35_CAMSA|nr:PREDICTED: cell wall protein DAN4-like [Camelina sativa]
MAYDPIQDRGRYTIAPWIMDSGVTHHITSDLANLSLHQPYTGGEEVLVGNGAGLPILHTGSASLPSLQRHLLLTNVLHVPNIQKNLISVYRLCNANNVCVEFFPAFIQVKDLSSGARLLQGRTREELYEWPIPSMAPAAYFATPTMKATVSDCHSRLGHPSLPILKTLSFKPPAPPIPTNWTPSLSLIPISTAPLIENSPSPPAALAAPGSGSSPNPSPSVNALPSPPTPPVSSTGDSTLSLSPPSLGSPTSDRDSNIVSNHESYPASPSQTQSFATETSGFPIRQSDLDSQPRPTNSTGPISESGSTTSSSANSIPSATTTSSSTTEPQPPPPASNIHPMTTRAKHGIVKPNNKYALTIATIDVEPKTVLQALADDKWRNSMSDKFNGQLRNFTWSLVPPAPQQNVIDIKWIIKIKYLPDGSVDKHKARLVEKGYNQQKGIDYNETFSLVIKSTTIRIVLQTAVACD